MTSLKETIKNFISNFEGATTSPDEFSKLTDNYNLIGTSEQGAIGLDHKDTRLLIVGQSGCGKTFLIRNYIKTLIQNDKHRIFIIDLEDDYNSLLDLGFVNITKELENSYKDITPENKCTKQNPLYIILEKYLLTSKYILVSYNVKRDEDFISEINECLLNVISDNKKLRMPTLYITDLLSTKYPENKRYRSSLKQLYCIGRKKGISTIFIAQRLYRIHSDIVSGCNAFLFGKTIIDSDIKINTEMMGIFARKQKLLCVQLFKNLEKGEFIISGQNFNCSEYFQWGRKSNPVFILKSTK